MLQPYLQAREDDIPVNSRLQSNIAKQLFAKPVQQKSFWQRFKFQSLILVPATGLAVAGLIGWQSYTKGTDSFMARAAEAYQEEVQNTAGKVLHTVSKITNSTGEIEELEAWSDGSRSSISVYDQGHNLIEKTIDLDKDTDLIKTYTLDDEGGLNDFPADQTTVCFGDMSGMKPTDTAAAVSQLTNHDSDASGTTLNRKEILAKILNDQTAKDLGITDGLHGFNITDLGSNVDYYLDETTLTLKRVVIHNAVTGEVTAVREETLTENIQPDAHTEEAFATKDLYPILPTEFTEKFGAKPAGCYHGDGTEIVGSDITLDTAVVNFGDAEVEPDVELEPVVCPSENCVMER